MDCQPDKCRHQKISGISPDDVTDFCGQNLRLGSVGVFVIVVGNYCCAAFYEASGASTCNFGFHIHVETNASPFVFRNSFLFVMQCKILFIKG